MIQTRWAFPEILRDEFCWLNFIWCRKYAVQRPKDTPSLAKNPHRLSPLSPQILRICLKVHDAARRCDQRVSVLGTAGRKMGKIQRLRHTLATWNSTRLIMPARRAATACVLIHLVYVWRAQNNAFSYGVVPQRMNKTVTNSGVKGNPRNSTGNRWDFQENGSDNDSKRE